MGRAMVEADLLQAGVHAGAPFPLRYAAVEEGRLHVLLHRELGDQVEGLEDEADAPVAQRGELRVVEARDLPAVEEIVAARGAVQAAEDAEQRRLARPRGAHHRHRLAGRDLEAHVAQRGDLDGAPRVGLADSLQLDEDGHLSERSRRRGARRRHAARSAASPPPAPSAHHDRRRSRPCAAPARPPRRGSGSRPALAGRWRR